MDDREEIGRAFPYRSGHTVNKHGYVRYHCWKMYAERGLAGQPVIVWRCGDHLLIEHQADIYECRPPPTTIARQERLPL